MAAGRLQERPRAVVGRPTPQSGVESFSPCPTLTFHVLYCFFVIERGRRKIPHFNVKHREPSSNLGQRFPSVWAGFGA
jgi:hypothetical protein